MKRLKVGIVGLGRIGMVHLKSLAYRLPAAQVVAASTKNAAAKKFALSVGVSKVYEEYEAVFEDPKVEAVVICSPTDTHLPYIKIAANYGQHIFCEKPLELGISKIEEISDYVKLRGVKLQVGFNKRFDTDFAKVRRQVQEGKIGDPHLLRISSRDPAPPPISYIRVSGGLFMDMTIHDFDMARFIVGSEVEEVYARGEVRVNPAIGEAGDIDTAIIMLKFKNGCLATIDNSRQAVYGYDQRLEIFGSKGMSQVGNSHLDMETLYTETGRHSARPLNFFMDRYTEAYVKEMEAFVQAVRNDTPVPVGSKDALMGSMIALAAQKSLLENRPVRMEELE